jgi:hypothetical protein
MIINRAATGNGDPSQLVRCGWGLGGDSYYNITIFIDTLYLFLLSAVRYSF